MIERDIIHFPADIHILEVVSVLDIAEQMRRITFAFVTEGPDPAELGPGSSAPAGSGPKGSMETTGPNDRVKMFFPDPATGVLSPPIKTVDASIQRPEDAVSINRDFTPLRFQSAHGTTSAQIEFDFYIFEAAGPATQWAATATPGNRVAIVSPTSSSPVPSEAERIVLIADETGLPAMRRWLELAPPSTRFTSIVLLEDEGLEDYFEDLTGRANIEWLYSFDGPGQLLESVRSIHDLFTETTYIWAAGEATELAPVRRFLKYDRHLSREQFQIEGYWKRGIVNRDVQDPVDPSDPD